MNLRRVVSLTVLVSFILLIVTSVILYIVPQGRIAYWAGWTLWGLSKTQWENLHVNLGLLFLLGGILHIYYNWNQIVSYLRNRARRLVILTGEFVVALILCLVFIFATQFSVPPFRWVFDLNASIKDAAADRYGEPPYGHAELSTLETFARRMEFDVEDVLRRLANAGYGVIDPSRTLEEVAKENQTTPQAIFVAMSPAIAEPTSGDAPQLPAISPPGTGHRRLEEVCREYQLSIPDVLSWLAAQSIEADPDLTFKEIAERNATSPGQVYDVIRIAAGQ